MATRGRPKKQPIAKKLETALGLAEKEINEAMPEDVQNALVPIDPPDVVPAAPKLSQDAQNDYEVARTNLHNLLQQGNKLLEGVSELALEGEHPRTYEVASTLLKTLIEGTRELMTLQKDIRDVEKKSVLDAAESVIIKNAEQVNNTYIEASTLEILDFMEKKKAEKKNKGQ